MGRILRDLVHGVQVEWRQFYRENFLMVDPQERLEDQLRVLYGKGEINADDYQNLRFRLHRGRVGETELYVTHMQAIQLKEAQGRYAPRHLDPALERWMDRLYADRVLLADMHREFEEEIHELHSEINWIKEQAESCRQDAARVLPDEGAARAFLEVWQKLLTLSQTLETQIQAMEQDLLDLNTHEVEIRATITKVKLLQSRQQLDELSQRIRHDLLTGG